METSYIAPDPVQWSEGMLLSPQHMQQNDIYWQGQLRQRLALLNPNSYGIAQLAIDTNALNRGVVTISALECVLPDGLVASFPGNFVRSNLSIDVSDYCKNDGKPVRVYIGVPPRAGSQTAPASSVRRYDALPGVPTADENTGVGDAIVERLQPHLDLYVAQTLPAGYGCCPLLEVLRDPQGHFRLGAYHPPMLRIGASAFLAEQGLLAGLRDVVALLWEKLRALAGEGYESGYTQRDEQHHAAIARHLAMSLPQFDVNVGADDTAPEMLYRSLAQVVGHVASIGSNPVPPSLSAYAHDDCVGQFAVAMDYIRRKLELINTMYNCFPFALVSDEYFAQRLPGDVNNELVVELRPRVGESVTELSRWLSDARIASDELMPILRQRRLPGALARLLTPQEISERGLRSNGAYYVIRNQHIEVDGKGRVPMFKSGRSLLVCGAVNTHMPASILLYQKKPTSGGSKAVKVAPNSKAEAAHV